MKNYKQFLTEASYKSYGFLGEYGMRLMGGSKQIPSLLVLILDSGTKETTNHVGIVELYPQAISKIKKAISYLTWIDNTHSSYTMYMKPINKAFKTLEEASEVIGLLTKIINGRLKPTIYQLDELARYKKIVKSFKQYKGSSIATKMVTDYNLSDSVEKFIDTSRFEYNDKNDFIKIHGFQIYFRSTMDEKEKETSIKAFNLAYETLKKNGLEKLSNVKIYYSAVGSHTLADYAYDSDTIRMDSNKSTKTSYKRITETIIHELGHRIDNQKNITKWNSKNSMASELREIRAECNGYIQIANIFNYKVGDELIYTGRKHSYADGIFRISEIKKDGTIYVKGYKSFFNPDFDPLNIKPGVGVKIEKHFATVFGTAKVLMKIFDMKKVTEYYKKQEINYQVGDRYNCDWYPTKYSEKNISEWWAEMFAAYCFNRLGPEQKKYIKSKL